MFVRYSLTFCQYFIMKKIERYQRSKAYFQDAENDNQSWIKNIFVASIGRKVMENIDEI